MADRALVESEHVVWSKTERRKVRLGILHIDGCGCGGQGWCRVLAAVHRPRDRVLLGFVLCLRILGARVGSPRWRRLAASPLAREYDRIAAARLVAVGRGARVR